MVVHQHKRVDLYGESPRNLADQPQEPPPDDVIPIDPIAAIFTADDIVPSPRNVDPQWPCDARNSPDTVTL